MARRGRTLQLIDSEKHPAALSHPLGIKQPARKIPTPSPPKLYASLSNSADKDLKVISHYLHDAAQWRQAFLTLTSAGARNRLRRMVQIGTLDRLLRGRYWAPSPEDTEGEATTVVLSKEGLHSTVRDTVLMDLKGLTAAPSPPGPAARTETVVLHGDVLQAAHWLLLEGTARRPCLINAASSTHPGGGYRRGAAGLEETLCRRTALSLSLEDAWRWAPERVWEYPIPEFGAIHSPNIVVLRDPERLGYPFLRTPFQVGVVSGAAYAQPAIDVLPDGTERISRSLAALTRRKIHALLHLVQEKGHDAVVIPAWGCGIFGNPAAHIAALFRDVLEKELRSAFVSVVFAILDPRHVAAFAGAFGVPALILEGADGRYTLRALAHAAGADAEAGEEEDEGGEGVEEGPHRVTPTPPPPGPSPDERLMLGAALARLAAFEAAAHPSCESAPTSGIAAIADNH